MPPTTLNSEEPVSVTFLPVLEYGFSGLETRIFSASENLEKKSLKCSEDSEKKRYSAPKIEILMF